LPKISQNVSEAVQMLESRHRPTGGRVHSTDIEAPKIKVVIVRAAYKVSQ